MMTSKNTINIKGLGITHKAFFAGVPKAEANVLVGILHELDKDGNGLLSLYELIAGCFLFTNRIENLQKTKKKLSWTSIGLGLLSIVCIFVAVWLSKDTSVSNGMLTVKGTDTPVETAVHHTVLHLGQPAGEDIALVEDATAPQGTTTKANPHEKVLGCMTRAEVVSLRENSVAIPAAIESEDGSLHTVFTRDWEEDDMGKIKITDASGVHYEIKPDPSCSTQIKHGRRLATLDIEHFTLTSGIGVDCYRATVEGTDFSDNIMGGAEDDLIDGGDGNDKLRGEGGNDRLFGGSGNDIIDPGSGNNYIRGDTIYGGTGVDKVVYPGAKSDYTFYYTKHRYDNDPYFIIKKNDGTIDVLEDVEQVKFADYGCTINEATCAGVYTATDVALLACPTFYGLAPYFGRVDNSDTCLEISTVSDSGCFVCMLVPV